LSGEEDVVPASNNRALSGSGDKMMKLWDLDTKACLTTFQGHTDSVHRVVTAGTCVAREVL